MARIIGGIGSSHSPTIGFALDHGKQNDPAWAPIFQAYKPVEDWLERKRPDTIVVIYNDHLTSFFFDHYSHFALGVGETYQAADEGGGARSLPPIQGDPGLAQCIACGLAADEFDLSFFQDKPLDHGCFSPLSMSMPHETAWPVKIVPFQIGVLQFPIPSALRCYKLGLSLRRAIESYPEDRNVVIFATGGLSHQVHGERSGFNNTEWDHRFLDLIENDPLSLTQLTHADYARLGGMEGSEVIMWLVMRAALSAGVKKVHQTYYLPTMTALATAIYENCATETPADTLTEYRRRVESQTAGIEQLEGTYPYTLERSVKGYRLNKFLHGLVVPAYRRMFRESPEMLFHQQGLTDEERSLVRNLNWRGMIHYGVSFFMLEKLGAVMGVPNLEIYAAMRGEPLDQFLKSRNAPDALYSVAGTKEG
ncbi:MAG TPA: gallate dioxygenase [Bryobacteraceae bacterium]|jgi:gallate dioxygenase|nr:gallate dioxygenase [Bryobacteraceae bacterium]